MEKALKNFCEFLKMERHLSDNTTQAYKRDIIHFADYCGEDPLNVDKGALTEYVNSMRNCGKAVSTVARNVVSLRSFYSFLKSSGKIDENPARELQLPKASQKLPMILAPDEVTRLLEQPSNVGFKGLRDKAMLELLYATGIKVSELIGLDVTSVNLRRRMLSCSMRSVPMGRQSVHAVSDYLRNARPIIVEGSEESSLFVNFSGKRMTRQGFWKILKVYKEQAGIDKEITPHMLRHSFAAHLLENGADLASIGEMMGLSDMASITVYKKIVENKIFDIYNKAHPRA